MWTLGKLCLCHLHITHPQTRSYTNFGFTVTLSLSLIQRELFQSNTPSMFMLFECAEWACSARYASRRCTRAFSNPLLYPKLMWHVWWSKCNFSKVSTDWCTGLLVCLEGHGLSVHFDKAGSLHTWIWLSLVTRVNLCQWNTWKKKDYYNDDNLRCSTADTKAKWRFAFFLFCLGLQGFVFVLLLPTCCLVSATVVTNCCASH